MGGSGWLWLGWLGRSIWLECWMQQCGPERWPNFAVVSRRISQSRPSAHSRWRNFTVSYQPCCSGAVIAPLLFGDGVGWVGPSCLLCWSVRWSLWESRWSECWCCVLQVLWLAVLDLRCKVVSAGKGLVWCALMARWSKCFRVRFGILRVASGGSCLAILVKRAVGRCLCLCVALRSAIESS